jgi:hypothetical protein
MLIQLHELTMGKNLQKLPQLDMAAWCTWMVWTRPSQTAGMLAELEPLDSILS